MAFLSEAAVELALLEQLRGLEYRIEREEDIGPDGHRPERESHDEVVLKQRFEDAVARLNPGLPLEARQDAVRRVMQSELPSLLEENRRLHKLMTEGVDVEFYANDGTLTAGKVALIDFKRPEQNDWLAVSQFVVINGQNKRRPDVVVFVNGLPLGVIELKAPGSAGRICWARSISCRPTRRRFPSSSIPMRCWSPQTALRHGWDRSRQTWSASCPGALPTARTLPQKARQNSRH